MSEPRLGVRWTIGDVSEAGFEALRLSVWGAWRVFGGEAAYAICVNSVPVERARSLTGALPAKVRWHPADRDFPPRLRRRFDAHLAEGVGWKLAPPRLFPQLPELSLDNDCILWELPSGAEAWLEDPSPDACLLAEDVRTCLGAFAPLCGPEPRNAGIRGLSAGFDLERALAEVLDQVPITLTSELDEQGLQVAALSRRSAPHVVCVDEVTICSPFPPHRPDLGTCGAHFVGLNARSIPWKLHGRPAIEYVQAHWRRHRPELYRRVGLPFAAEGTRAPSP